MSAWVGEADALAEAGKVGPAIARYQEAVAGFEALALYEDAASAGLAQGFWLYQSGDPDAARAALEMALSYVPDSSLVKAFVLDMLTAVYDQLFMVREALSTALESLALKARLIPGEQSEMAFTQSNLGSIYYIRNDFAQAEAYYRQSYNTAMQVGDQVAAASTGVSWGLCLLRLQDYPEAVRVLRESLMGLQQTGASSELVSKCRINLGLALIETGQAEEGIRELALAAAQAARPRTRLEASANQGYGWLKQGKVWRASELLMQTAESMEFLAEEEPLSRMMIAKVYLHAAQAFRQAGRLDAAGQALDQALAAHDLGIREGELQDLRTHLLIEYERSKVQVDAGELKAALETFATCEALIRSMRSEYAGESGRQSLASYCQPIYASFLSTIVSQPGPEANYAALAYAEGNKSLLLMDALLRSSQLRSGGLPDSLVQRETELRRDLEFLQLARSKADSAGRERIREQYLLLEAERSLLMEHFRQSHPDLYNLRFDHESEFSLQELPGKLAAAETSLLEFFWTEEAVYLLAFGAVDTVLKGPSPDSLDLMVRQLQASLSDWGRVLADPAGAREDYVVSATWLYAHLLEPVYGQDHLPARLRVVPDGLLGTIPFEALLTGRPTSSFLDMPYLIRSTEIAYSWSAALYARGRAVPAQSSRILGFAPGFSGKAYQVLPAAQEEISWLAQRFPGRMLRGGQANEASFKAAADSFQILHLATHGVLNPAHAGASFLAMAEGPDAQEDNLLYSFEVEQMNLSADLVVLSACETGSGQYLTGEGVMSMARSFIQAGASSVLMSLWKVEDAAGSDIVQGFYEGLAAGRSRGAALRQAKLGYLDNADDLRAHPAFWANFVLVGEDTPLKLNELQEDGWARLGLGLWTWMAMGGTVLLALATVLLFWRRRQGRS